MIASDEREGWVRGYEFQVMPPTRYLPTSLLEGEAAEHADGDVRGDRGAERPVRLVHPALDGTDGRHGRDPAVVHAIAEREPRTTLDEPADGVEAPGGNLRLAVLVGGGVGIVRRDLDRDRGSVAHDTANRDDPADRLGTADRRAQPHRPQPSGRGGTVVVEPPAHADGAEEGAVGATRLEAGFQRGHPEGTTLDMVAHADRLGTEGSVGGQDEVDAGVVTVVLGLQVVIAAIGEPHPERVATLQEHHSHPVVRGGRRRLAGFIQLGDVGPGSLLEVLPNHGVGQILGLRLPLPVISGELARDADVRRDFERGRGRLGVEVAAGAGVVLQGVGHPAAGVPRGHDVGRAQVVRLAEEHLGEAGPLLVRLHLVELVVVRGIRAAGVVHVDQAVLIVVSPVGARRPDAVLTDGTGLRQDDEVAHLDAGVDEGDGRRDRVAPTGLRTESTEDVQHRGGPGEREPLFEGVVRALVVAGLGRGAFGLDETGGLIGVAGDDVGVDAGVPVVGRGRRRRGRRHSTVVVGVGLAAGEGARLQRLPLLSAGRGGEEEGDEDDEGEEQAVEVRHVRRAPEEVGEAEVVIVGGEHGFPCCAIGPESYSGKPLKVIPLRDPAGRSTRVSVALN